MINRLRNKSEVFWFFFSKKNLLPYFHSSVALIANWYYGSGRRPTMKHIDAYRDGSLTHAIALATDQTTLRPFRSRSSN